MSNILNRLKHQKISFDDAFNLTDDIQNRPEPIPLFEYIAYPNPSNFYDRRPILNLYSIMGNIWEDERIIVVGTGHQERSDPYILRSYPQFQMTEYEWDKKYAELDKQSGTSDSGWYTNNNFVLPSIAKKRRVERRSLNVSANDPKSRLYNLPVEMINNISKYGEYGKPNDPFKTQNELRGAEAYNNGTQLFIPTKVDENSEYNPLNNKYNPEKYRGSLDPGLSGGKNRKSRKNKYKNNKSKRKYKNNKSKRKYKNNKSKRKYKKTRRHN